MDMFTCIGTLTYIQYWPLDTVRYMEADDDVRYMVADDDTWRLMQVFVCPGTISGFCAMCELQSHISRVFGPSGVAVRPVQIVQSLKSEPSGNQHA